VTAKRWALLAGAAVLAATAAFHATGLGAAVEMVGPRQRGMMQVLWLTPVVAWGGVALLWALAGLRPLAVSSAGLLVSALIPLGSAALLAALLDPLFPGTLMLAASAILAVTGAILQRP
jgi:hypothetical protein